MQILDFNPVPLTQLLYDSEIELLTELKADTDNMTKAQNQEQ